jgi:hypothetical protein
MLFLSTMKIIDDMLWSVDAILDKRTNEVVEKQTKRRYPYELPRSRTFFPPLSEKREKLDEGDGIYTIKITFP